MNPVIKWAGGKRRLAETIVNLLGGEYDHYYEPFVGGAAVLLYMEARNATCSDINPELINLYKIIKTNPEGLINSLQNNYIPFNSKEFYYKVRSMDRDIEEYNGLDNIEKAARFMYLNRTCYNGLWRVNKKGQNNVPYGRYVNPAILSVDSIREASEYFNRCNVIFDVADYMEVEKRARSGDLVYFDPPYDVEEGQSGFVDYTQDGFTRSDQEKLKSLCDRLIARGVRVGISNSNTQFIRSLYTGGPYNFYELFDELTVKRYIGATIDSRRELNELFILGYQR